MKFLHTADWHIGRKLHEYALEEEQADALDKLEGIALEEKVDAVVIAGDIYDRGMPSENSVRMVNGFLKKLNLEDGLPLLAISGNHDSAERLATGADWFAATSFYMSTSLEQALKPVEIGDVQFFLLPYFELSAARRLFADEGVRNVDDAVRKIVGRMKEQFRDGFRHVLVAHFFAAGSLHSDSETRISVGGLDAVGVDSLDCFDYVALGHLHQHHASRSDTVRYSGSLLKYSVSEVNDDKGVYIVDTDAGTVSYRKLEPLNDVRVIRGMFDDLLSPERYRSIPDNDYVAVELEDKLPIPDAMNRLKVCYPRVLELRRVNGLEHVGGERSLPDISGMSDMDLFCCFYREATGEEPDEGQCRVMKETLEEMHDGGEE